MKTKRTNTYIISLGGSLIAPKEGIDYAFLKKFRALIIKRIKNGDKFIIIAGGGATCRAYQKAAAKTVALEQADLDLIGINLTKFHAHFLKIIFSPYSFDGIIDDPTDKIKTGKKIIIGGGWKPGCSTDKDAVLVAETYGAHTVINLTNIDYVYDKNPKEFPDAKRITEISWSDFRKIVGNSWKPGLNLPFDPVAAKKAEALMLKVIIANGKNLNNLSRILSNQKFIGTTIG
jgi:uridylate kinase